MKNLQKIFIVAAATLLPISALALGVNGFTIANSDGENVITSFKNVDGTAFPGGWLTAGYVDGWGGTDMLTAEHIMRDFQIVGTTLVLAPVVPAIESNTPYATLGIAGLLEPATWTADAGVDLAQSKTFVVLVGNGTSFKSEDNTEISALTYSVEISAGNATALTWGGLLAGAELYIDFGNPSLSLNGDMTTELTLDVVFGTHAQGTSVLALAAIPEPSMFGLLAGLGALALVGSRRRRK